MSKRQGPGIFAAMANATDPTTVLQLIRVLVVDDSAAVVSAIRQFLAAQPGVTVAATALGGRDAIEACRQHQPDLVVMDVHMPELDGLKSAAKIRTEFPNIRILLISVDQGGDLHAVCLRHGADGFLPKIGLQRTLMAEIQRLLPNHKI